MRRTGRCRHALTSRLALGLGDVSAPSMDLTLRADCPAWIGTRRGWCCMIGLVRAGRDGSAAYALNLYASPQR